MKPPADSTFPSIPNTPQYKPVVDPPKSAPPMFEPEVLPDGRFGIVATPAQVVTKRDKNQESLIDKKIPKSLVKLARIYTRKAMQAIVDLLDSKDEMMRFRAAELILERGWGKPCVYVETSATMTLEQIVSGSMEIQIDEQKKAGLLDHPGSESRLPN